VTKKIDLNELKLALDETHKFVDYIHLQSTDNQDWHNLVALIHILDHMQRLHERCDEEQDRAMTTVRTPELLELVLKLRKAIDSMLKDMHLGLGWLESPPIVKQVSEQINEQVEPYRQMVMTKIAQGKQDIPSATSCLEAIRWLERVSDHLEHLVWHFQTLKI
jgi:phosphate:Na+ symporter